MDCNNTAPYDSNRATLKGQQSNTISPNHIKNGRNGHTSASVREWLWFCCNCAMSVGQTNFIDDCPECQHKHCMNCPWGPVDIDVQETLFGQPSHNFAPHDKPNPPYLDISAACGSHPSSDQSLSVCHNGQQDPKLGAIQKRRRSPHTGAKSSADPRKSLACHFHKRYPERYNPWAGGDKFLKCLYPSPCELRHMKDHLSHHALPYYRCQNCHGRFQNENELLQHEETKQGCAPAWPPPSDGIDLRQWKYIEDLISTKRNPGKSREQRWYDIWEIIHPGSKRPQSPYSEPPSFDITSFLADVEYNAEFSYVTGILERDEHIHSIWIDVIKQSLGPTLDTFQDGTTKLDLEDSLQPQNEKSRPESRRIYPASDLQPRAIAKAKSRQSIPCVRVGLAPSQGGKFDDIFTSKSPINTGIPKSQNHSEEQFAATKIPPPIIAKSPVNRDQGKIMLSTSNLSASHCAQITNVVDSGPIEGATNFYIDNDWPPFEDLFPFQDADTDFLDPDIQFNELFTLFQTSENPFAHETSLPFGEQVDRGINACVAYPDLAALLSSELELPGANCPIEDWRDTNRGLEGKYKLDGTM